MRRRALAWLLRLYPGRFRRRHGAEYLAFLEKQRREDRYRGVPGSVRFWAEVTLGALVGAAKARLSGGRRESGFLGELPRAWRRLRRRPGLTAAVALTLGVAVGFATAAFGVVDATLLAPLPYSTGERIVLVRNDVAAMDWYDRPVGRWVFQPLEEDAELFGAVAATREARVNLILDGEPRATTALRATAGLFRVFGTQPAAGRLFGPAEDRPGADRVVVLSHDLWQSLFGGDRRAVGRTLTVDGVDRRVIGVLPEDFRLPGPDTRLVLPLAPNRASPPPVGNHDHVVYGLLPPGTSLEEAENRMQAFNRTLRERYPDMELADFGHRVTLVPLKSALTGEVRPTLLLLLGAGGLLFLLACANVSNLLLARAEARRMERSVRLSLGASHAALGREALAESLVLALAGSALGLALAALAAEGLDRLPAGFLPWTSQPMELVGPPLLFALAAAAAATLLVGVLPAVATRRARARHLLGRGRGSGGDSRRRSGVRRILVTSQVFLSVVLLSGAALLGRTLLELADTDPGFRAERVTALELQLPRADYPTPDGVADFGRRLAAAVTAVPGVEAAAVADRIPLQDAFEPSAIRIEGQDPEAAGRVSPDADFQVVEGAYFETMGIPLLQGRIPEPGSPGVVVNRAFAEELLPDGRVLQQRIALWAGEFLPVVGVVGDVRLDGLDRPATPQIYYPFDAWAELVADVDQWGALYADAAFPLSLLVRDSGASGDVVERARRALGEVDPGIPVARIRTLSQVVAADRAQPRLTAVLVGTLALAGLLLAAVGTYAVLAHSVNSRGRELGIRLALGASPRALWLRTTLSGLGLVGLGLVAGVAVAWSGAGLLEGLLFGVAGDEPGTYLLVILLVGAVALAASLGPALRAARTDPVASIRSE